MLAQLSLKIFLKIKTLKSQRAWDRNMKRSVNISAARSSLVQLMPLLSHSKLTTGAGAVPRTVSAARFLLCSMADDLMANAVGNGGVVEFFAW